MARRRTVSRHDEKAEARALVLFVDIRGFTSWSDTPEVFSNLNAFALGFNDLIRRHFLPPHFVKALGDGAMIVRELEPGGAPRELLGETLATVKAVDVEFAGYCQRFQEKVGHKTDLRLGWGIVRGDVRKLPDDYVGSNINKCARLCGEARPFGVILDRYDFPDPPENLYPFSEQTRKLGGLDDVDVWVTPEISAQFVPREKIRQKPEVHIAGVCVDRTNRRSLKILLAKRSPERSLFPGLYEGCGGQLALSETFEEGVVRHYRKELGIEVRVLPEFHCFYEIREPNEPLIPGIRFLCERIGDREPKSPNHSEFRWVTETQLRDMAADLFVGNMKDEALGLLEQYKRTL